MGVAQRLERRVVAPKAVGSIPIAHPNEINELQAFVCDSFLVLLPYCYPVFLTPIATRTGTLSILFPMRISKQTPSTKIYLNDVSDKSRVRHFSATSISSLLTLLTSPADILRPISFLEILERLRVLIPVGHFFLAFCIHIAQYYQ